MVDWDSDGKVDLLVNSTNVDFFQNISDKPGEWRFKNRGAIGKKRLAGHTTSPTVVDWDLNGQPDLLVGAEDGFFYFQPNPHQLKQKSR